MYSIWEHVFALTCSLRIDKPTGLDHHIHAIPFWVSKPIKLFETTRWLGCSKIEGLFFPGSAPFGIFCFAVYNTYMHLCYVCICYIIHTESTVNGRSDSTISECWWLSPPRRGHRSGWYPPVSSNMAMSRKSTLIIFPSRNLHLSPFIIIHRGFPYVPWFSHGFPMVFPWFSHL